MERRCAFALALMLLGCGPEPSVEEACQDYVDAWEACVDEAYANDLTARTVIKQALGGTCDKYERGGGYDTQDNIDLFHCYADAIDSGDCGNATSYGATIDAISGCVTEL